MDFQILYALNSIHSEILDKIMIGFTYLGEKSFLLDKPDNNYVKLDFEVVGNEDDGTRDMSIHIEKCILRTNKNMYFTTNNSNAIDLRATVIYTGKDYITLK